MRERKLVYGVGINDADYFVQNKETIGYTESGKQIQKLVWICPFYLKWQNLLKRCYSKKALIQRDTYEGCWVVKEWHRFTTFKAWMETQDWEGKHLDKDLLFSGNKVYGPDTCVFISQEINSFLIECGKVRGEWPIGVSFNINAGKFRAMCSEVTTGKQKFLGYYSNPTDAHKAWLTFKLEQAKILASRQSDLKIAKALINRYENYGD